MKKTLTLLFMLLATLNGYSQFSKTHYIPPLTSANSLKPSSGAAASTDPDVNQYIYISTPSTTPVTVTITPIGSTPVTQTVTNANPWVYTITTAPSLLNGTIPSSGGARRGFDNQLFVDYTLTGTVQNNRGFLIEATDLVYVNVRVSSGVSGTSTNASSSQAGGLVSKGLNAYGTEFRIGGMENKTALDARNYGSLVNFASFIATEDNTTVTITLPRAVSGLTTFHNGTIYTGPITVTLNKNESYVFAIPNTSSSSFDSNLMLGGHITSDRNIVVNCGSIGGNSQIKNEVPAVLNSISFNTAGKDYGFDQIVSSEKTGKEYIFVGGAGMIQTAKAYDLERAIIIANVNNTQVFKEGTTLVATLNAGEYYVFNGNDYTNGNLYVTTSENVFAYQCIGGKNDAGNQNMFFVPPLNCGTPSIVNNIPLIEQVGIVMYPNTVINITTESTSADPTPTIIINGTPVPLTGTNCLRNVVIGKPGFVTYTYPRPGGTAPTGNISITAPNQVYVSYYGSNNNATYGGYYSGFANDLATTTTGNTLTATQTGASYQWYKCPNTLLDGAINQSYSPTSDGDYKVAITSEAGCTIMSDCVTFNTLGVENFDAISKLVLYPNPTTGILNIESNIEDTFTLVNQLGQVVKTVKVTVGANKVNLENLVDGVYFLKNKSVENQVVKKIIKN